jgi:hypothetical protein
VRAQARAGLTAAVGLLAGLVALVPARALAHDEAFSTSDVVIDNDRSVTWTVDVGLAGLAKVVDLGADVVGGEVRGFDQAGLAARRPAICAAIGAGLTVTIAGTQVAPVCGTAVPRYETGLDGQPHFVRLAQPLVFTAAAPFAEVRAKVAFFSDLTSSHRAVVKVRWGGQLMQTTRLGVSELVLTKGQLAPGRWSSLVGFVGWGIHHILVGYDHIAFLLGLLLVLPGLRPLITVITAFTVAHSLTILLAAFRIISLPTALTETLIAASIVYVAIENLVRAGPQRGGAGRGGAGPRRRWPLVFAFGLVHGLGFAEVLRERLAEAPAGIAASVVAFNLGVELGQLAIVAVAFPLLTLLRQRLGDRPLVRAGSLPILLLGLYWLATRLSGA